MSTHLFIILYCKHILLAFVYCMYSDHEGQKRSLDTLDLLSRTVVVSCHAGAEN